MSKVSNTLGARSLILSLLLRTEPPQMRGARLVQWCGLFGVAAGTARVALSRMVERGELRTTDGTYELAGRVGRRRTAQDWSIEPELERWTGEWRIAVVTTAARTAADRGALRDAMRRVRTAELREGVWTRPDNLPSASAPQDAWDVVDAQCVWWTGSPDRDSVVLAADLFDPASWAKEAERLTKRLARVTGVVDRDERHLADAFVAGAAALTHVRNDPLLPAELGPSEAAGDDLRAAYRAYERRFSAALRAWFRSRP
jgi:phenylacetic acid degradation operon negative regulatory protein